MAALTHSFWQSWLSSHVAHGTAEHWLGLALISEGQNVTTFLNLIRNYCRGCFQEVHGSEAKVAQFLHSLKTHCWRYFACPDPKSGGFLLCISNALHSMLISWTDNILVPGRLVRSELVVRSGTIVIYNVHDFEWDSHSSQSALALLRDDVRCANDCPLGFVVIVLGDFNRTKPGEHRQYTDPIEQANF